jgi:hypothetical protein
MPELRAYLGPSCPKILKIQNQELPPFKRSLSWCWTTGVRPMVPEGLEFGHDAAFNPGLGTFEEWKDDDDDDDEGPAAAAEPQGVHPCYGFDRLDDEVVGCRPGPRAVVAESPELMVAAASLWLTPSMGLIANFVSA